MFLTFNKQNFQILECAFVVLLIYVVFTMLKKHRVEGAHCSSHKKERFTNMRGVEGMGHMKVEGMGHMKVKEPYGNKRMYR